MISTVEFLLQMNYQHLRLKSADRSEIFSVHSSMTSDCSTMIIVLRHDNNIKHIYIYIVLELYSAIHSNIRILYCSIDVL